MSAAKLSPVTLEQFAAVGQRFGRQITASFRALGWAARIAAYEIDRLNAQAKAAGYTAMGQPYQLVTGTDGVTRVRTTPPPPGSVPRLPQSIFYLETDDRGRR